MESTKLAAVSHLVCRINIAMEKHWADGKTNRFGRAVRLVRGRTWWYIRGIDTSPVRRGYVYARIRPTTMDVYTPSGIKPICKVDEVKDEMIDPWGQIQRICDERLDQSDLPAPPLYYDTLSG